jgi:hypothetical protein
MCDPTDDDQLPAAENLLNQISVEEAFIEWIKEELEDECEDFSQTNYVDVMEDNQGEADDSANAKAELLDTWYYVGEEGLGNGGQDEDEFDTDRLMDFMNDDTFVSQEDPDHGIEVVEYPEKCPDFYADIVDDEEALQ